MRQGVILQRAIGDGRELCVIPRLFNTILTIGREDDRFGYDQHW